MRRSSWYKFIPLAGLFVAGVSLACSLSPRSASSPTFVPPGGENSPTHTPAAVTSIGGGSVPTVEVALPETGSPVTPEPQSTSEPEILPTPTLTPTEPIVNTTPIIYYTQAGDTLPLVATRFGVPAEEIFSPDEIPERALFNPGQVLVIPNRLANTTSSQHFMPDSEVVFSPSALDFDVTEFSMQAGGFLSEYSQYLATTGVTTGPDVVQRIAIENSINPRLLLALLEYQAGWVYDPEPSGSLEFPLGQTRPRDEGLYRQLAWTVNQLSRGYYGWREGRLTEIEFKDGITARLAPDLNAGTAALQYYFAQLYDSEEWLAALDLEPDMELLRGSAWRLGARRSLGCSGFCTWQSRTRLFRH